MYGSGFINSAQMAAKQFQNMSKKCESEEKKEKKKLKEVSEDQSIRLMAELKIHAYRSFVGNN